MSALSRRAREGFGGALELEDRGREVARHLS
jgi:hypothetical protein